MKKLKFKTPIFDVIVTVKERFKETIVDSRDWVNIIAFTKDDKIIFVDQYRYGIKKRTLETPGGIVDKKDKNSLAAAKRELLEETGYASNNWKQIGYLYPNPAFMNNKCFIFLAKGCRRIAAQRLDTNEKIHSIKFYNLEEIAKKIKQGKINHSIIVASFMLLLSLRGMK